MSKLYILVAPVIIVMLAIAIWFTKPNASQLVLAACNTAHNEINGVSEQQCGDLQDKYKLTYLCNYGGCRVKEL